MAVRQVPPGIKDRNLDAFLRDLRNAVEGLHGSVTTLARKVTGTSSGGNPTPGPGPGGGGTVTTSVTVTWIPEKPAINETVLFTAVVSGSAPTGTINFSFDGVDAGSITLNAKAAEYARSWANRGNYTVQARYSGDATNPSAVSAEYVISVGNFGDGLPPPAPTSLTVTPDMWSFALAWTNPDIWDYQATEVWATRTFPAYNTSTTYALNAKVADAGIVYRSKQAGNTNNALPVSPATETPWWIVDPAAIISTRVYAEDGGYFGTTFFGSAATGPVDSGETWAFWVRNRDVEGLYSDYYPNDNTGVVGTTLLDPRRLLEVLTAAITESQLYADLGSRIDLIDGPSGMSNSVNARLESQRTDLVSQISSVAVGGGGFDTILVYFFDTTVEGWTNATNTTLAITGGALVATATGSTPSFQSPVFSTAVVGATYPVVRMRVQRTGGTGWTGTLTYTVSGGSTYTKTISEPSGVGSGYVEATWDLSADTNWTGSTITRIKFQLGTASGDNYAMDWVGVGRNSPGASYAQVDAVRVLADFKNRVFYQSTAPASDSNYTLKTNDLWFDTSTATYDGSGNLVSGGNKAYRWNGSAWIASLDARLADAWSELWDIKTSAASPAGAAAQRINGISATASAKIKTYYQTTAPTTGLTVGDLWYDTANNSRPKRWNGSAWVDTTDTRLTQAQADIITEASARAAADSSLATQINVVRATAQGGFDAKETWNFDTSAQGWTATNGTATQTSGVLSVVHSGADAWINSPAISVAGSTYSLVRVRVRRIAGSGWDGSVFYNTWSYVKQIPDPLLTTDWTVLEWDMSTLADWRVSTITSIRIDLGNTSADRFEVDWIAIGRNAPAASKAQITDLQTSRIGYAVKNSDGTVYDGNGTFEVYPVSLYPAGDYPQYVSDRFHIIDQTGVDRWNASSGTGIALTWRSGLPLATAVKQVTVNDGGGSVALEQRFVAQRNTDTGLLGQYTVKIDNNGYVSGFGLASTPVSGIPLAEFMVRADRFSIAAPNSPIATPYLDVSSLTRSGTTATATVLSGHGLVAGDFVTISNVSGANSKWNGSFILLTAGSTTVTFGVANDAVNFPSPATPETGKSIRLYRKGNVPFIVVTTAQTLTYVDSNGVTQTATVQPGVYMNAVWIMNASIYSAAIQDAAVINAKIGNSIYSSNYDGGNPGIDNPVSVASTVGWALNKNGQACFNNVRVRGDVLLGGSNRIQNSDAKHGFDGVAYYNNGSTGSTAFVWTPDSNTPSFTMWYLNQPINAPASYQDLVFQDTSSGSNTMFVVEAGKTYQLSASVATYYCTASLIIDWYTAAGGYVGRTQSSFQTFTWTVTNLAAVPLLKVIGVAPSGAVLAKPFLSKGTSSSPSTSNSAAVITRVMFCEVPAGQVVPVPWSPGGISLLDTLALKQYAVTSSVGLSDRTSVPIAASSSNRFWMPTVSNPGNRAAFHFTAGVLGSADLKLTLSVYRAGIFVIQREYYAPAIAGASATCVNAVFYDDTTSNVAYEFWLANSTSTSVNVTDRQCYFSEFKR